MKIFGFHDNSGCGWYRLKLPFWELEKHGHQIGLQYGWGKKPEGYSIIVGERLDKPEALPIWRRLAAGSKLIYEIDDDIFNVHPENWMAYQVYGKPVPKDVVAHAAEVSDMVTVTTESLAQVMKEYNDNVVILPNHIPAGILDIERQRRNKLVVGWAGGASHALDLASVAGSIRRFLDRNRKAEFHMIGTDYSITIRRECRFTPWANDQWEYFRNIDFDIGIAPLIDSKFNRSKSAIKAMEYSALGIPVVASDIEPYRDFIIDGVTGFLIKREHEWAKRISELANDPAMREEMGKKAKEIVSEWTIEKGYVLWEQAYEGLLK